MKYPIRLLSLIMALMLALSSGASALFQRPDPLAEEDPDAPVQQIVWGFDDMTDTQKFEYILELYSALHLDGKTKEELLQQLLEALIAQDPDSLDYLMELMVNTNDQHNHYLSKAAYDAVFNSHELFGIGIKAYLDGDKVRVDSLYDGSAKNAGILVGDQIIAVDGKSTAGMDVAQVGELIKTEEEGSTVTVTILRNSELYPIDYVLTREAIYVDSVTYSIKSGVGYIKIDDFTDLNAYHEYCNALIYMQQKGIDRLVLDVRDNSGGYLYLALNMINVTTSRANLLIATTHNSDGTEDAYYTSGDGVSFKKVAVLVNGATASSAEVFAGGLKDLHIATMIGTQTYGKARGQQYFPLGDDHYLSITMSDLALPVTGYYHDVGITPDKVVENAPAHPMTVNIWNFDYAAGNSEDNVRAAQQKLGQIDFYWDDADGIYDESVQKAITIFQNRHALPETGMLDETTMRAIDSALLTYSDSWVAEDTQLQVAISFAKS